MNMNAKELQQLGIVSQFLAGQEAQKYRPNIAFREGGITPSGLEYLIGPKTNGSRKTNPVKPTNANNLTNKLAEQRKKNERLVKQVGLLVEKLLVANDSKKNPKKSRSPVGKHSVGKQPQSPSKRRKPPRARVRTKVWT